MSFTTLEASTQDGKPVTLYEFERDGIVTRYAASDEDVVLGGNTYTALAITNEGIVQSGEPTQDEVKITVPLTIPVVQQYLNTRPSASLYIRIRRLHRGDTVAPIEWMGTLDRVKAVGEAAAEIVGQNAIATLQNEGLRLGWTRSCTHMLYDNQCRVPRVSFRRTGTVDSITGNTVVSSGLAGVPVGALAAGYLEWVTADGFTERRTIVTDNNGSVVLMGGAHGLAEGMNITAYFGCPRTPEACATRFLNLSNYGGFNHIPERSPFDGNPVF